MAASLGKDTRHDTLLRLRSKLIPYMHLNRHLSIRPFITAQRGTRSLQPVTVFSEQSYMRPVAHPLTHENDRCMSERPPARVRFSINISGGPVAPTISLFSRQPILHFGAPDDA
jgi:hypothetical protein